MVSVFPELFDNFLDEQTSDSMLFDSDPTYYKCKKESAWTIFIIIHLFIISDVIEKIEDSILNPSLSIQNQPEE